MRASRLLAILILLQLRTRLTAQNLADEFEVSLRTIYRDIDALSAAGVPVYGEKGPGGGFRLLGGYKTQLTGLDAGEAQALPLIGLPGAAADLGMGREMQQAKGKLMAALPAGAAEGAGRIAARFHLDTLDWYRAADEAQLLPALARAVLDDRLITMRYDSWRGEHDWQAEPLGLVLKGGTWYLVARARDKMRTFRISEIRALTVQDDPFDRDADFDLAAYWAASLDRFEAQLRPLKIRLSVSPEAARLLARDGTYAADALAAGSEAEGGWRLVSLPVESIPQAALLLLGLGQGVDVLDPPALAEEMKAQARAILNRLETRHGR